MPHLPNLGAEDKYITRVHTPEGNLGIREISAGGGKNLRKTSEKRPKCTPKPGKCK